MNKTIVYKASPSLALCIVMDAIGYLSFGIPFLGEFSDIIWAPLSAYIFYKSFGGKIGSFGALFNFAEEILPFTDFIPTFTITWIYRYITDKRELL
ncbi:MAG: hypothetical protein LH478_06440 [Chitinophagaceae bacterium]|nr:hypothetical protein [Chitinophagaceae bacterium]